MFTKNPLYSKTIQGLLVTLLPYVLPLVGIDSPEHIDAIVTAAGVLWGTFGRVVAKGPLLK